MLETTETFLLEASKNLKLLCTRFSENSTLVSLKLVAENTLLAITVERRRLVLVSQVQPPVEKTRELDLIAGAALDFKFDVGNLNSKIREIEHTGKTMSPEKRAILLEALIEAQSAEKLAWSLVDKTDKLLQKCQLEEARQIVKRKLEQSSANS